MEEKKLPLEKELEPIFLEKLPAFPDNIKDIFVMIAPWGALIGAVILGLGFLAAVGLGSFISLGAVGVGAYGSTLQYWVAVIAMGAMAVMYALAFSPLRANKRAGWNFMYYVLLISLVSSLIGMNLVGFIISGFIGFWILFQTRSRYN